MIVILLLVLIFLIPLLDWIKININRKKNLLHVPGPTPLPIIGNAHLLAVPHTDFIGLWRSLMDKYGPVLRLHLGTRPTLFISTPEAYEKILSNPRHITKTEDYEFSWDWLGRGLGTSNGMKWHSRRRMLSPAFHFKILENCLIIMNQNCDILCNILENKATGTKLDIYPIITNCALDIICESAMGQSINAQLDKDPHYVETMQNMFLMIFNRQISPWLWSDWAYQISPSGKAWQKCIKALHGFTDKVIKERESTLEQEDFEFTEVDAVGSKKRVAFLDLLIRESKAGGHTLLLQDIREEVNTFMAAGFDTTAGSISFTLQLLAEYQDCQRKCQEELDQIFQGSDRAPTAAELSSMKYLECCIKESLRLFPSVPIISRKTGQDENICGFTIPMNTNVMMPLALLQRNASVFPDPDTFNPDRFTNDNIALRHSYASVPFSGGPRNCIGQKFAMMEEKVILSSILRRFNLKTESSTQGIPILASIVLRPLEGINISLTRRS